LQYAGIVVTVARSTLRDTMTRLNALPGVEVHQTDAERGKIIAVLRQSVRGAIMRPGNRRIVPGTV
jgi:nitrate reductase NapAB chaperone NapD